MNTVLIPPAPVATARDCGCPSAAAKGAVAHRAGNPSGGD